MAISLVMTIIGPDRPGLVGRLSAVIADHGGNWLESRMARLGGQFAGILRIQVPSEREQKLLAALQSLEDLSVSTYKDTVAAAPVAQSLAKLEVVGHDRPGIIRQISEVLAQHRVNVEELGTHCESAPMSADLLFHATATVRLPAGCSLAQLQAALETIAADLMVDIAIIPQPAA